VLYAELSKVSTDCLFFRRHHFLFSVVLACALSVAGLIGTILLLLKISSADSRKREMPRLAPLFIFSLALTLSVASALAQNPPAGKPNTDQAGQQKMKNSEDPSSPAMQQAAAKQADCKKQAKAQKLGGARRRAFMKDCAK